MSGIPKSSETLPNFTDLPSLATTVIETPTGFGQLPVTERRFLFLKNPTRGQSTLLVIALILCLVGLLYILIYSTTQ